MVGFAGGGRAQVEMEECTLVRPPGCEWGWKAGAYQNRTISTPLHLEGGELI